MMITLPRQTMALFPSELKEEEEKEDEDEEEETANKNKMASHRFRTDGADGGNKPRRHGNDLQEGNRWKQKRNNKTAISHTKKNKKQIFDLKIMRCRDLSRRIGGSP